MELDLSLAEKIVTAAKKEAEKIAVPMVIAVADQAGNLILLQKMDGALLVSIELAPKKAYTAISLAMPSHKLGELAQPGAELYGIDTACDDLVLFGGGIPIYYDGEIIGAIGVSGGSVKEDIQVAQAGIDYFEQKFTTKGF